MSTGLVGGGPAAAALITAAACTGCLEALLDDGLTLICSNSLPRFGSGRLGGYLVRSDTRGRTFAECATSMLGDMKAPNRLLERCANDKPVSLRLAADLLAAASQAVLDRIRWHPRVTLLAGTTVTGLKSTADSVTLYIPGKQPISLDRVVLAVGGRPRMPTNIAHRERLVVHSDSVLRRGGYGAVVGRLTSGAPRVTIIGGSHGAFAVAGLLLRSALNWAPGAITVAHRSAVRVTYPDVAAARADGVLVDPDQVCPATGVVHRFGGLRADAATLYQRVRRGTETRVRLVKLADRSDGCGDVARDDPVIIAATGYDSAASVLLDGEGYWGADGRLRTAEGDVIPRLYGLGLGTRRTQGPTTGGEPAYRGAIDGVWFYQNIVAPELLSLLAPGSF